MDIEAYRVRLEALVHATGSLMKAIFAATKKKRMTCAEGQEARVLRACQVIVDEGLARPTLAGRPTIIAQPVHKFGLRLGQGVNDNVVNIEQDPRYRDFWQSCHRMTAKREKIEMRRHLTLIAVMQLKKCAVDEVICSTWCNTAFYLNYVDQVIGRHPGVTTYACMSGLTLPERRGFLVDTRVNNDPSAQQIAEVTILAAQKMMRTGLRPQAARLSHANFGVSRQPSALKIREVLALSRTQAPGLEAEDEMHDGVALNADRRQRFMPGRSLAGKANLRIFSNLDAANIVYNLLKAAAGGGISIAPIFLGAAQPVHSPFTA